jgi:hypothetical protein
LRNPRERWISSFQDRDPKGFGLMQRDRVFAPVGDDVVVGLVPGRQLDEAHLALAPRPLGLDPVAGC